MPRRRTQEEFEKEALEKLGPDYVVLGKYVNKNTKILMKHLKCGNEFLKNPHDVTQKGSGCPYCNGTKPALYNEKWVIEHTPAPYHYISGYTSMNNKCLFHCDICGADFKQKPTRLINEHIYGCNCCPTKKKTPQDFLNDLGKECLEEYDVLEEYINIDTPILFKHKECGTEFKLTPYQFITRHNKKYCPLCYYKKSKGEVAIASFLSKKNIPFKREYMFNSLPGKKFDFYLPNINTCIEYDGEQHFIPVEYFGGEDALIATQERDKEKNSFCIKNGIPLIRITYNDFQNINNILEAIFEEKSPTTIEKYFVK